MAFGLTKGDEQINDTTKVDQGYELYGQKRQKMGKGAKAVVEQLMKRKMDDKNINMMEQPLWGTVKKTLTPGLKDSGRKTMSSPTGIGKPELAQNIAKRVVTRPMTSGAVTRGA